MGSLVAMDAEQKRDDDGKFGSGGGFGGQGFRTAPLDKGADPKKFGTLTNNPHERANENPALEKSEGRGHRGQPWPKKSEAEDASSFQPDPTAAMQGEAGRLARKQARDCMSGRFRP